MRLTLRPKAAPVQTDPVEVAMSTLRVTDVEIPNADGEIEIQPAWTFRVEERGAAMTIPFAESGDVAQVLARVAEEGIRTKKPASAYKPTNQILEEQIAICEREESVRDDSGKLMKDAEGKTVTMSLGEQVRLKTSEGAGSRWLYLPDQKTAGRLAEFIDSLKEDEDSMAAAFAQALPAFLEERAKKEAQRLAKQTENGE